MESKKSKFFYHTVILLLALAILVAGGFYRRHLQNKAAEAGRSIEDFNATVLSEIQQLKIAFGKADPETVQAACAKMESQTIPYLIGIQPIKERIPSYRDRSSMVDETINFSGIVIEPGIVITSARKVIDKKPFEAVLSDGSRLPLSYLRSDSSSGIALFAVSERLTPKTDAFVNSNAVPVLSETLIRIGRVSSGKKISSIGTISLIDGKRRLFLDSTSAPEQEGGAVFDLSGNPVGIVVHQKQIEAVVPFEQALQIVDRLRYREPKLSNKPIGLEIQNLTDDLKKHFGIEEGVLITNVENGSIGEASGFLRKDVITEWNQKKIGSVQQLLTEIRGSAEVEKINTLIFRGGKTKQIEVKQNFIEPVSTDIIGILWKFTKDAPPEISKIQNPALSNSELKTGDRLIEINGLEIFDLKSMNTALKKPGSHLLLIQRNENRFFVVIPAKEQK
jgi:S1-C subfamily serine protease